MRIFWLLFVGVLMCFSNLTGLTAAPADGEANGDVIDGDLAANNQTDNGRPKLKLLDLNDDVLFLIVENIQFYGNLEHMFNLTDISPKLTPIIAAVFRIKFSTVTITNGYGSKYHSDPFDKSITLCDFDIVMKALERFGSEMQEIHVKYLEYDIFGSTDRSISISQSINKHAKSLKLLDLDRPCEHILQQFTEPFEEAEELNLLVTKSLVAGNKPLNETFPKLKRLGLSLLYSDSDYNFIDCEFPHLEHLSLNFDDSAWKHRDQIESFLRKNKHVKSVHLGSFPRGFLKEVPELLPNIESLNLNIVYIDDAVELKNVKNVTFYFNIQYVYSPVEKVSLPQLESVSVTCNNVYSQFFDKHTNLTRLHLESAMDPTTFEDLAVGIASKNPHLMEIKLDHGLEFSVESIQQIIDGHSELMKIELSSYSYSPAQLESYRNELAHEWDIRHFKSGRYYESVVFERKE